MKTIDSGPKHLINNRRLVKKYHPDAVIGMGKDVVAEAEVTFRKIQTAYEQISKERGIK